MASFKKGFAFYNVDTDRYQDIRIKRLKKELGCNGIAVYDYILCEIYRVRGCFIVWDESTAFDVAEYFGLKETLVMEIVNYCCNVGLFDKELRASGSVLTSSSIQRRYTEMCKRAKRSDAEIPEEIRIITEELPKLPEKTSKIPEEIDRVEKSKVENITTTIPDGIDGSVVAIEDEIISQPKITNASARGACPREGKPRKTPPPIEQTVVDIRNCTVSGNEWRTNFDSYLSALRQCYKALTKDEAWLAERKRLNPRVDVLLTLEKACIEFWATEAGWKHKKKEKSNTINWRATLTNSISAKFNKVYENVARNNQNSAREAKQASLDNLVEAAHRCLRGDQG